MLNANQSTTGSGGRTWIQVLHPPLALNLGKSSVLFPHFFFFYKIFKNIFILFIIIYFWLHWVFVTALGFSLVVASRGYSLLRCEGFSLWWLLLLWSTSSRRTGSVAVARGLSSCGSRALECRLSSCGTWAHLLRGM